MINVVSGSPAEAAGLQTSDIIVEVNGTITKTSGDLTKIISALQEDTVALKVYRTGVDLTTAADLPTEGKYVDLLLKMMVMN